MSRKCKVLDSDLRRLEEKSKNIRKEKQKVYMCNYMVKNRNDDTKKRSQTERKFRSRENPKNKNYKGETEKNWGWTANSRQKRKESHPEAYKNRIMPARNSDKTF